MLHALSATLLWQVDAYRSRMWPVSYNGTLWHLEAVAGSLFGSVKVLKSDAIGGDGNYVRVYFQDGLVQNVVRSDGKSLALYTFAMEALARAYRPDMRSVLMLGLGAGITPMRLANAGLAVEAVEIDRASIDIATRYFGFEPRRVTTHVQDARTFLRTCDKRYDIVLVDLFHGDGMPDYLLTREFFSDLKGCLDNRGVAVFNSIAEVQNSIAYAHFLATLHAELPAIALYRPADEGAVHVNSFVVAAAVPLADPLPAVPEGMPAKQARILAEMLRHPRPLDAGLLRGGVVVTDERNAAAGDLARAQLSYRTALVRAQPPAFLLN